MAFKPARITVITPTYNRGGYLSETIESVLAQGIALKYIVIDDGSTDDTEHAIGMLRGRVSYVRQDNAGEVKTVNRGLRMVRTEYFAVVNSDDPLLPGSLRKMMRALDENPDALAAYCDWEVIGPKSEHIANVKVGHHDFSGMLDTFNLSIGPGAVFRTKCLDEIGLRNPQLRFSADLDYWFRIALTGQLIYIPEILATHRTHSESASAEGRTQGLATEVSYMYTVYGGHPKNRGPISKRSAQATGEFAAAFSSGDLHAMVTHLLRSLMADPVQFLSLFERMGGREVASHLRTMGAIETRLAEPAFRKVFHATSRRRGLAALARACRLDPVGVAVVAGRFGSQQFIELLGSLDVMNDSGPADRIKDVGLRYNLPREKLLNAAADAIRETDVVVDIGCGIVPMNYFRPEMHIMVEPWKEYSDILSFRHRDDQSVFVLRTGALEALGALGDKSVDSVFLLDVIEHLPKDVGFKVIAECERVAREQIVLFTPLGFMPQHMEKGQPDGWGLSGASVQEHLSGWIPEDFSPEWSFYVSDDFHQVDFKRSGLDRSYGAFFAIRDFAPTGDVRSSLCLQNKLPSEIEVDRLKLEKAGLVENARLLEAAHQGLLNSRSVKFFSSAKKNLRRALGR